jgi:hypothetical protein
MSESALYRLLTFRVLNLVSIFLSVCHPSKESVQVRGPLWHFVTSLFFTWWVVSSRQTPKQEDHPLSPLRDCSFNMFVATLHIWKPCPPSATWGPAMPWWQGTHLTWHFSICCTCIFVYNRRQFMTTWVVYLVRCSSFHAITQMAPILVFWKLCYMKDE